MVPHWRHPCGHHHAAREGGPAPQVLRDGRRPSGQEANKKVVLPPEQFLFAGGGFHVCTLTFDPQANTVRGVFIDATNDELVTCDQTLRFAEGA